MERDVTKRLERIKHHKLIMELINDNKLIFAKEQCEDYIKKYNDDQTNIIYGNILYKLGDKEKAIEMYKEACILKNKHAFFSLLKISFDYDDLLYSQFLLKQCLQFNYGESDYKSLCLAEIYINSRLGLKINPNLIVDEYIGRQLLSYNESEVLEHIKAHYHKEPIFNENVNIDLLFEDVKKKISSSVASYTVFEKEVYYFNYPNAGYENGIEADYLLVIVIRDTKEIFNIYPKCKDKIKPDCIINNLENQKKIIYIQNKIRMSQVDKFNKKYNTK